MMALRKLLLLSNPVTSEYHPDWRDYLPDFHILEADGVAAAGPAIAAEEIDCALILGVLPDGDPVEILEAIHGVDPRLPVVFWDPEMRATEAVRLIRGGAHSCIGHRDSYESLRESLEGAVEERRCRLRVAQQRGAADEPWRSCLVGESRAMKKVVETIRLIGPRRCTVLITGETGTGKEMAARALHLASPRASQPWVAINCSALPEPLLEAELFGHVRGAFTGAINTRIGRFEQANKGTLFLDEIGDMPIGLQAKLLRVLQEREVQRLGSSETIKVDVRVIAASNLNLQERVKQGKFREDLYYRLNVVPLPMPPLRQRESDIPLLAHHFVRKICQMEGIPVKRVTPEGIERLRSRAWPGNIRQLENAVEMAVAMSGDSPVLSPGDFGPAADSGSGLRPIEFPVAAEALPDGTDFDMAVSQFERSLLERALLKTSGNKTAAAQMLGMKRTTLIMKLRSFENARLLQVV